MAWTRTANLHTANGPGNSTEKITPSPATQLQTCAPTESSMTGPWISLLRNVERLRSLVALLWPPMAKAELLLRAEEPESGRRPAALFREAIFSPKRRARSTTTSRSSTNSNRRDPSAAGLPFAGLLPLKSIDGKSKSGLYRPHENKYNWINSGVLLFGRDG